MKIHHALLTIIITLNSILFCMEKPGPISLITRDLLGHLLITMVNSNKYPWEQLKEALILKRVCKGWENVLPTLQKLLIQFKIPPMHYAALTNNFTEIIRLKLEEKHSQEEGDGKTYTPAWYAAAGKAHDALTMLHLSNSVSKFIKSLKETFTNIDTQNALDSLVSTKPEYTSGQIANAVQAKNYQEIITILSTTKRNDSFIKDITDAYQNPTMPHDIKAALLFALQNTCEHYLLQHAQNNTIGPNRLFTDFKTFNADPNKKNRYAQTFLHKIIQKSTSLETFSQLLQLPDIDLNATDYANETPLHYAVHYNKARYLQALIVTKKCDINSLNLDGHSPLMLTAENDNADCMKILLDSDANQFHCSTHDVTLLESAVRNNAIRSLKILLERNTLWIDTKDSRGSTALIVAAKQNKNDCAEILINNYANINAHDDDKQTPLHWAASKGHNNIVKLLLDNKAQINCRSIDNRIVDGIDYGGYTPLHFAAHNGHTDTVKLLLEYKADSDLTTQAGKTALELAHDYKHEGTKKVLWEHLPSKM